MKETEKKANICINCIKTHRVKMKESEKKANIQVFTWDQ